METVVELNESLSTYTPNDDQKTTTWHSVFCSTVLADSSTSLH